MDAVGSGGGVGEEVGTIRVFHDLGCLHCGHGLDGGLGIALEGAQAESCVDILSSAGLLGVDCDGVLAVQPDGLARRLRDFEELVGGVVACGGHGENSIDIHLRVFVVEDAQAECRQLFLGDAFQLEVATDPNLRRAPCGADSRCSLVYLPESCLAGLPAAAVVVRLLPSLFRFVGGVAPDDVVGVVASRQHTLCRGEAAVDGLLDLGTNGCQLFFVDLEHLAVVGEDSVDLLFHVGDLGVNGSPELS